MSLGTYSETTRLAMKRLIASKGLEKLVPIKNPLDINPGADDEVHAYMAELLLNDENIDAVVIGLDPLSPVTHSLAETDIDAFRMDAPDGILTLLSDVRSRTSKPMVAVMDGGEKFDRSARPSVSGASPYSPCATGQSPHSPFIWSPV